MLKKNFLERLKYIAETKEQLRKKMKLLKIDNIMKFYRTRLKMKSFYVLHDNLQVQMQILNYFRNILFKKYKFFRKKELFRFLKENKIKEKIEENELLLTFSKKNKVTFTNNS